uniref:Uncharacterized protein n=1 Tax=Arundo donax TaxID=35708 RepID=A0A0A8XYU2_ARUDO
MAQVACAIPGDFVGQVGGLGLGRSMLGERRLTACGCSPRRSCAVNLGEKSEPRSARDGGSLFFFGANPCRPLR